MVENCTMVYENLPNKVGGFIFYDGEDDWYTMVLNCRMSYEGNRLTFAHEMLHIENGDIHGYKEVGLLEAMRHQADGNRFLHKNRRTTNGF